MTKPETVTVERYSTSLRDVKGIREAARTLGATEVVFRACGQWLDENSEPVDLTRDAVPVRDVKSVWVEASVNGKWIRIRPNSDPHFDAAETPRIQVEITLARRA